MKFLILFSVGFLWSSIAGAYADIPLDRGALTAVASQTGQIQEALQTVQDDIKRLLDAESQWLAKTNGVSNLTHDAQAHLKSITSALTVIYGFKDVLTDLIGTRGSRATLPPPKQLSHHVSADDIAVHLGRASAELKRRLGHLKHQGNEIAIGETFELQSVFDHLQQASDLSKRVVATATAALGNSTSAVSSEISQANLNHLVQISEQIRRDFRENQREVKNLLVEQTQFIGLLDSSDPGTVTNARSELARLNAILQSLVDAESRIIAASSNVKFNPKLAATPLVTLDADLEKARKMMEEMLKRGDVDGAILQLQTTQIKSMDEEMKTRATALEQSNSEMKTLNDKIAVLQKALAADPNNPQLHRDLQELQTRISQLNSQSQLEMTAIQNLVNRRNQTLDLMSDMMQKFQDTLNQDVGTIR